MQKKRKASREELLGRCLGAFVKAGTIDLSLDQLAKRVGISKRMLVHYFGGRENIEEGAMTLLEERLRDYDATPTIRTYVLISQDEPRAMVYTRDADGRLGIQSAVLLEGADATIEIPEFGLVLPFSALYEGLELASDRAAAS